MTDTTPPDDNPYAPVAGDGDGPDGTERSAPAPPYASAPESAGTGWSNGRMAAILVGLVALIGGTFLAVSAATGGGDGPETAIEDLFDAISNEDMIGVLTSLDPEERRAIEPGLTDIADQLKRLGVLSDDFQLDDIDGVDVEIVDLETETTTLTDDLVAVTVTDATLRASTQPDQAPLGEAFEGTEVAQAEPTVEEERLDPDDAFTLVAIRRDGWHVSIGFSILYNVVQDDALSFPDPADGVQPDGADSPSDAVRALVQAGADLDLERMLTLLPPGEMDALHAAAPLFLADAQAAIEESLPPGAEVSLADLSLSEEDVTDGVRVRFDAYTFSVRGLPEGDFTVTFDGECTTVSGSGVSAAGGYFGTPFVEPGQDQTVCFDDLAAEAGPFAMLFDPASSTTSLVSVERDGEWYVSPTRSALDIVVQILAAIPDDGVESFFDHLMSSFFGFSSQEAVTEYGSSQEMVVEGEGVPIGELPDAFGDAQSYEELEEMFPEMAEELEGYEQAPPSPAPPPPPPEPVYPER